MNFVCLSGYVGVDPKVYVHGGMKVAKISLSTRGFRNNKEAVDWHNVDCFKNVAEYVDKYVKKGDYVMLTGYLSSTEYTAKDGNKVKTYNVKAHTVEKPAVKEDKPAQDTEDYSDIPY